MKEASSKPTGHTTVNNGKYLYAVAESGINPPCAIPGIYGGSVYWIVDGEIAVAASDVPNEKIRPERRHLSVHQAVIKKLMEERTVLPMAFGLIADSAKTIEEILARNREAFLGQLHRVAGKVEMGIRVTLNAPNIFEHLVNMHSELRATRDRLFGICQPPSHGEKIELGRMFERVLNEDREACTQIVETALKFRCFEIKRRPMNSERGVMNLACLVERENLKPFEAGVLEAAKSFSDDYTFDLNGPWAPHNFTEINLDVG